MSLSLGLSGIFLMIQQAMNFGEEDHRGELLFSLHHIKDIHYGEQYGDSLKN